MLKLKLQNFGHLMRRTNLLEKTLMLGKIAPDAGRPQATPPCCLGSLALGQPCAEAVERDVLLAEGGMGHQVPRQTVPHPPPQLPPPGVEGAGE